MFDYVESELERNIVTIEENQRISPEYRHNVIRIFLTLPEAREMLRMIKTYETQTVSCGENTLDRSRQHRMHHLEG